MKELQVKIHGFEQRFNDLKKSTRESLESRNINKEAVVECLTNLPAADMPEHKLYLEKHMSNLLQVKSLLELFLRLNLYWNYLAYHLLEHLIKEFSVEEMKGKIKEYKGDLWQFMWDTPLKMFCQAQKKRVILPEGFTNLVAEFKWPENMTLAAVEKFRQEYGYHCNLHQCAMMVIQIFPGSFTVVWGIPESIIEHLRKEVAEVILSTYAVTRLEIAGACVYEKVMTFIQFMVLLSSPSTLLSIS